MLSYIWNFIAFCNRYWIFTSMKTCEMHNHGYNWGMSGVLTYAGRNRLWVKHLLSQMICGMDGFSITLIAITNSSTALLVWFVIASQVSISTFFASLLLLLCPLLFWWPKTCFIFVSTLNLCAIILLRQSYQKKANNPVPWLESVLFSRNFCFTIPKIFSCFNSNTSIGRFFVFLCLYCLAMSIWMQ